MFFYVLRMSVCSPPLTLAFPPETEKYSKYFLFFGSLASFSECDSHSNHKAVCVFIGSYLSFLNLTFR